MGVEGVLAYKARANRRGENEKNSANTGKPRGP